MAGVICAWTIGAATGAGWQALRAMQTKNITAIQALEVCNRIMEKERII
jgi:hypothetical protein